MSAERLCSCVAAPLTDDHMRHQGAPTERGDKLRTAAPPLVSPRRCSSHCRYRRRSPSGELSSPACRARSGSSPAESAAVQIPNLSAVTHTEPEPDPPPPPSKAQTKFFASATTMGCGLFSVLYCSVQRPSADVRSPQFGRLCGATPWRGSFGTSRRSDGRWIQSVTDGNASERLSLVSRRPTRSPLPCVSLSGGVFRPKQRQISPTVPFGDVRRTIEQTPSSSELGRSLSECSDICHSPSGERHFWSGADKWAS